MPRSAAWSTKYPTTLAVFSVRAAVIPVTKTSLASSMDSQSKSSIPASRNGVYRRS